MTAENQASTVYLAIADWYERQGNGPTRDQFLILAADAAHSAGRIKEANQIHQGIVQANPHHLLKPFQSFDTAIRSQFVQAHVAELRQNYPPSTVEHMLELLLTDTNPGGLMDQEPPPANPDNAEYGTRNAASTIDHDPAIPHHSLNTSHSADGIIDAQPAPPGSIPDWGEDLVTGPIPENAEIGIGNEEATIDPHSPPLHGGLTPRRSPRDQGADAPRSPPISGPKPSVPERPKVGRARSARIELEPVAAREDLRSGEAAESEPLAEHQGVDAPRSPVARAVEPEPEAPSDSPPAERSELLRVYRESDETEENEPSQSAEHQGADAPRSPSRPTKSRQKRRKKANQPDPKKAKASKPRKAPKSQPPKPKPIAAHQGADAPRSSRPLVPPKPYWAVETSAASSGSPASTYQASLNQGDDGDDLPSLGWVSTALFVVLMVAGFAVLMISVLRFF